MPKSKSRTHPFDVLALHFAEVVAQRVGTVLARAPAGAGKRGASDANARRSTKLKGRKLDMSCRVRGCKNRSGGPRWGFICEEHRKQLSKKQQQAARDTWNAKKAAA